MRKPWTTEMSGSPADCGSSQGSEPNARSCVAKCATLRAARPGSSLRKKRSLGMTRQESRWLLSRWRSRVGMTKAIRRTRGEWRGAARKIPRLAGESASLRDDASVAAVEGRFLASQRALARNDKAKKQDPPVSLALARNDKGYSADSWGVAGRCAQDPSTRWRRRESSG